ncbi:glycosyltransferase family 2 protein [Bradyrhizobium symbiodeficiens]|uniref:glycosyltransferase family 2 protein n=1 Tax=Bradyrhizobium symbiodeficiens TaxID=1404367 RepID=UPI00140F88F5|nr:glycosyltransferase family A protein [Bradyrhizobium symbiodeficiens]QIP01730.1 glycosyltransferase family 2 protein [Bradyrhizobium symbiodeficiens]
MRNAAATIGAAVRSVQLQTLRDWELIVIDDGSSDKSAEIVGAFEDDRIRLIREATSAGLATRLNQAVALSRGDYVARLDADDICFPERLARQVEHLQHDPRIDLLGCGAVVFADDARLVGMLPIEVTHAKITAQPFRGFPLPHPTWCGRADWFRNNPYDARLMKTQDQDLLLRAFAHGRFAALTDVLVGYRQDELGLKKMLQGRRIFIGSLWRYAQRSNWPMPALWGIIAQLLKGAADVATIGLGFRELAQRSRLKPVPPSVEQRWLELQLCVGINKAVD